MLRLLESGCVQSIQLRGDSPFNEVGSVQDLTLRSNTRKGLRGDRESDLGNLR